MLKVTVWEQAHQPALGGWHQRPMLLFRACPSWEQQYSFSQVCGAATGVLPRPPECIHFIILPRFYLKNTFPSEKSRPMQVWLLLFECEYKTKHTIRTKLVLPELQNLLGGIIEGLQVPYKVLDPKKIPGRGKLNLEIQEPRAPIIRKVWESTEQPHIQVLLPFRKVHFVLTGSNYSNVLPFIQYNLSCHLQSFFLKAKEKIISL